VTRSLWLAAALVVGAVLANTLLADNGYVAISFHGYLVEMSVPTLVLCLVLALLVLEGLARLARWPRRQRERAAAHRRGRAEADLARGLLEVSAGRWTVAQVTLTRSARDAAVPTVHYLAAAHAANLAGDAQRTDAWLALAREAAGNEDPAAVLITSAEMFLKRGDTAAALEALEALPTLEADPRALLLLARVHRQRGDFDRLRQLEPRLRATRGIPAAAIEEIMDALYADMLRVATERGGVAALDAIWDEATRAARNQPAIAVAYARGLARFKADERAAMVLRRLVDASWYEPAVALYGELEGGDAFERLKVAEGWLRTRREDPTLLVACARLCLRAELWGKARSYLELSQARRPRAETAQLLASLLERLGERERALALLVEALAAVTGTRASIAAPRQRQFTAPRRPS
jgi:HemY protein